MKIFVLFQETAGDYSEPLSAHIELEDAQSQAKTIAEAAFIVPPNTPIEWAQDGLNGVFRGENDFTIIFHIKPLTLNGMPPAPFLS